MASGKEKENLCLANTEEELSFLFFLAHPAKRPLITMFHILYFVYFRSGAQLSFFLLVPLVLPENFTVLACLKQLLSWYDNSFLG